MRYEVRVEDTVNGRVERSFLVESEPEARRLVRFLLRQIYFEAEMVADLESLNECLENRTFAFPTEDDLDDYSYRNLGKQVYYAEHTEVVH